MLLLSEMYVRLNFDVLILVGFFLFRLWYVMIFGWWNSVFELKLNFVLSVVILLLLEMFSGLILVSDVLVF